MVVGQSWRGRALAVAVVSVLVAALTPVGGAAVAEASTEAGTVAEPTPPPWVLTGGGFSPEAKKAFITVTADGTDGGPGVLEYDNVISNGAGDLVAIDPPITIEREAVVSGTYTLPYDFDGDHAQLQANVGLDAFVRESDGTETVVTLYDPSAGECCDQPESGFATAGTVELDVDAGESYGFRISGSNLDTNSRLRGILTVGPADVEQVYDAPQVAVFAAARTASSVDALGRLLGDPNAAYLLQFAGTDAGDTACAAATLLGDPVAVVTDADGGVDFGASFEGLTVPPDRVQVVAATRLVVVDDGTGGFTTVEATVFDATSGFEGSNCAYVGLGNDAWTSAVELPVVSTAGADPTLFAIEDVIEQPGGARWYRFDVAPNARATIDVSGLGADYDLAVFTDIDQEYTDILGASPEDALNRLGAEFAPSAFSPSAFSPSAFSPSAFSPSAFSPSAFSPSAFSPSAFSPSAFSPSAFSPSAFSPSAFSPSAFSPSAFSPSAFSPSAFSPDAASPSAFSPSAFSPSAFSPSAFSAEAYSSAQVRALVTVSANEGTADEFAIVNTWNNDTSYYVRVAAKPGAASVEPYDVQVSLLGTSCDAVERDTGAVDDVTGIDAGPFATVVLWDSSRLDGDATAVAAVDARLDDLAGASAGLVVDLADHDRVQRLQAQADANASCVYAANLVAEGIKDVVDTVRATSPDLDNIVLVGGDDVVPFFRYPDTALLGPESDYVPPVDPLSRSEASLRQNYVLGQDEYGASVVLSLGGMQVPVPELAVGRLVETPDEIIGMIDQWFASPVTVPTSTLVTGYDFMIDVAEEIQAEFVAGTGGGANDELIAPVGALPEDTGSWTAFELYDAWLAPPQKHDVVYLAGHFSANSALAADYETQIVTTEIATSGVDLAGTLVFSNGCHTGYNIVDGDAIDGLTLELDWAQALAREGATFIGGTGYQYGDTDLVEYSERLYANLARELRRGEGAVSVGEAMVRAKLEYLASTPDPRGLHRKSLLISTIFGLPMTAYDMPGERLPETPPPGGVAPSTVPDGPGAALGLATASIELSPTVAEQTVTLDVLEPLFTPEGEPIETIGASYLVGPDGTSVQPTQPILPLVATDVSADGTSLRGVAFRGGTYVDEDGIVPLSSAAGTELGGSHVPFASEAFFPMRLSTPNYYDALGGGATQLLTTPVQHRVDAVGLLEATRRVFTGVDLELYYSADVTTYTGTDERGEAFSRTPALAAPPQITGIGFSRALDGTGAPTDDVLVEVGVVGDPAAGVQDVWIVATEVLDGPGPGTWVPLDLVQDPEDSRRWTGVLPGAAAEGATPMDVLVQAVNGVGLVSTDDNNGRYHRVRVGDQLPSVPTVLTIDPPVDPVVGDLVEVGITLVDDSGAAVADAPVLVTFGPGGRTVVTGSDGTATAVFLVDTVGTTSITATYRGDEDALLAGSTVTVLAPSATATTVEVGRAPTTLGLAVDPATNDVVATVTRADGSVVPEVTVLFDVDDDPSADVAVITDDGGTARVAADAVAPTVGTVTAAFDGTATLLGSSASVTPAPAAPEEPPTVEPSTFVAGETTEVTVTATLASDRDEDTARFEVTDADGTVVITQEVVDDGTWGAGTVVEATLDVSGLAPGTYEVTVTLVDSGRSLEATSDPTVITSLVPTALELTPLATGDVLATLTQADGDPLTGVALEVVDEQGDPILLDEVTGDDGVVTITVADTVESVTVSYAGDDTRGPSSASIVPVPAAPGEPAFEPGSVVQIGEDLTLTAALPSVRGSTSATVRLVDADGVVVERDALVTVDADGSGGQLTAVLVDLDAEPLLVLEPGVYDVSVTVTNATGTSAPSPTVMLVVFDPDGGSVNGAGWLLPRAGDLLPGLAADASNADKANFGFNVRYQQGRKVLPAGTATFRYLAGGLDLVAEEFDWLAVTNSTGGIFQGLARVTVEGEAPTSDPWTFVIDVRDRGADEEDEFGIKIWHPDLDPALDDPTYRVARNVIGEGTIAVDAD